MCGLWLRQECRYGGGVKHISGGARRVSLWRGRVAELCEAGTPGSSCVMQAGSRNPPPSGGGGCQTYLRPRVDANFGFQKSCNDDLLEYCAQRDFQLIAYSPLLGGAYIREDRKLQRQYHHRDSDVRKAVLFGSLKRQALHPTR